MILLNKINESLKVDGIEKGKSRELEEHCLLLTSEIEKMRRALAAKEDVSKETERRVR